MTAGAAKLWTSTSSGVRLRVRLTPKSSRDQIDAVEDVADGPALKARVRAVPEDGKANAAIVSLIADWLGVPKATVAVAAGQKSRVKTLALDGNAAELGRRIDMLIAQSSDANRNNKRTGS